MATYGKLPYCRFRVRRHSRKMATSRRCREKFRAALYALAVREGDVRQRLRGAHFHLRVLSPGEVPQEFRAEFSAVLQALTKKGPELGPDGQVYKKAVDNTLDHMQNRSGRRIAERIYALARELE